MENTLYMEFDSNSENEQFARSAIAAFTLPLTPSVEEISDVKTAVSEAVTNCVVHAYKDTVGKITVKVGLFKEENKAVIEIFDQGDGIADVKKAMKPFYTTKPDEERAGLGFAVMQALCDSVEVENLDPKGLKVTLTKIFG